MLWRWIVLLAMASTLSISGAQGQEPERAASPTATNSTQSEISTRSTDAAIKVRVNLVLVRVVVRDGAGKIVPGLKQEDFQVFDKGKRQKISAFNVETLETRATATAPNDTGSKEEPKDAAGAPAVSGSVMPQRFLALVFDDSHLKSADAMAVRSAAQKLFASLTPTDRVAIYSSRGDVEQDFRGCGHATQDAGESCSPSRQG